MMPNANEDLNMKSMSASGWGMFVRILEYKLENIGKRLIKIDKYYPSSQTCSVSEYQNKEIKNLSLRDLTCPVCGTYHSRDINATQMLLG